MRIKDLWDKTFFFNFYFHYKYDGLYKMYDVLHDLWFFFLLFGLNESCVKVLWQMWHQAFVQTEIDLYSIQILYKLEIFLHFKVQVNLQSGLDFWNFKNKQNIWKHLARFGDIRIMIIALT